MTSKKITKYFSRVSFAILICRIFGYIRDMFVAKFFGAGLFADAFYAAYRIPNLFRRLLGEGALSASFIPVFTEYLTQKTKKEAEELFNAVFTTLFLLLSTLTILGIIFAPELTRIVAWGFEINPQKLELTITLVRIMFPYLLLICLAALLLGTLNALHIFFLPSLSPLTLDFAEIVYILIIAGYLASPVKGLAVAVVIGGLGQFAFQLPILFKNGWRLRFKIDFRHPGLRRILFLMLPAMIGFSVEQINSFIDTLCGSFLKEGSVTALYYSNRLMQLPLALFGIAMAMVSLPLMSKSASEKNIGELKETLSQSLRTIFFIIIPASIGLMVLAEPIVRLLFERGAFNAEATKLTSRALFYYALGTFAYAGTKIVAAAFYSLQDTRTPLATAAIALSLNVALNLILMVYMGVGGLALATAISSMVNLTTLLVILRLRLGRLGLKRMFKTVGQTLLASAGMGVVCYLLAYRIFYRSNFFAVSISITVGVILYFFLAHLLKIEERKPLLAVLQKEEITDYEL